MIDDLVPAATRPCEQERDAASFFLLLSLLFFKSTAARIAKASMEHTKPQDVRIQGYQDVTQDFRAACQDMHHGQMAHVAGFTLLESMGAIEIMDPRMDSGIFPVPPDLIAECDRLPREQASSMPAFAPDADLSAADVCWIMDRTLACEVAWHMGAPLAQTVHTCLYLHQLSPEQPPKPSFTELRSSHLVRHVLRPFIVALIKSVSLAWDELVKDNLTDGEDFCGDKAGIELMYGLPTSTALEQLDEAILWLLQPIAANAELVSSDSTGEALTATERASLVHRLRLRRTHLPMLSLIATADSTNRARASGALGRAAQHDTSAPQTALSQLGTTLQHYSTLLHELEPPNSPSASSSDASRPSALQTPRLAKAPSAVARAAFDLSFARRLASSGGGGAGMPPPRAVELPEPEETIKFCLDLVEGVRSACVMLEKPSWAEWKAAMAVQAIAFQRGPACAFIRSLRQSVVCSQSQVAFGRLPLAWLPTCFLEEAAALQLTHLSRHVMSAAASAGEVASRAPNVPPPPPSSPAGVQRALETFMQNAAAQLVNHLCCFAQNRSRGKRRLAKTYEEWVKLTEEAAPLGQSMTRVLSVSRLCPRYLESLLTRRSQPGQAPHPDVIFACTQHVTLDMMLHLTLSGLELELYRQDEWGYVYWMAANVAREQHVVLSSLADEVRTRREVEMGSALDLTETALRFDKALRYLADQSTLAFAYREAAVATSLLWRALHRQRSALTWPLLNAPLEDLHLLSDAGIALPQSDPALHARADETLEWASFMKRFKWIAIRGRADGAVQLSRLFEDFQRETVGFQTQTKAQLLQLAQVSFKAAAEAVETLLASDHHISKAERPIMQQLLDACKANAEVCQQQAKPEAQEGKWEWGFSLHPWFPVARPAAEQRR